MKRKCLFHFRKHTKFRVFWPNLRSYQKNLIFATLSVFAKILGENKCTFRKNSKCFQLRLVIVPVLHIFSITLSEKHIVSRKCSHKQIFCGKSAKISWHQIIFTRIVLLFHMLLSADKSCLFCNMEKTTIFKFREFSLFQP